MIDIQFSKWFYTVKKSSYIIIDIASSKLSFVLAFRSLFLILTVKYPEGVSV